MPDARTVIDRMIAAEVSGDYESWAVRVIRDERQKLQGALQTQARPVRRGSLTRSELIADQLHEAVRVCRLYEIALT